MKATVKRLNAKGDKAKSDPTSAKAPSGGEGGRVGGGVASGGEGARVGGGVASGGDDAGATAKRRASVDASPDSSSSSSRNSSSSGSSNSELSSFALSSSSSRLPVVTRHRLKRPDSPRVQPPPRSCESSSSSSSSGGSSSSCGDSASFSVPESEAFWSELPALKPLINPGRLQALRLCSRDQQQPTVADDGGDATMIARPASPPKLRSGGVDDVGRGDPQQQQKQQQQKQQEEEEATWQSQQTLACSNAPGCNQCNNRSPGATEASTRCSARSGEVAAGRHRKSCCDGRSELKMAESASCPRHAIYQYSFRVPDTKANMRAFVDPSDRRVEAIARACDSEILLDPEPIRTAASSSVRLRRVTIRAPDQHSLEKCCRMFDDKFPKFYVSGGLGPDSRCVSKVYDDGDERDIAASNDEWS